MIKKLEYKDFINGKLLDDLKGLDLNSPNAYIDYGNIVDKTVELDAKMIIVLSKVIAEIEFFYEKNNDLSPRFYPATVFKDDLLTIRLETESELKKLPADAKIYAKTSLIKLKMVLLTAKAEYDRSPEEFKHMENLMKSYDKDGTKSMNLFD